jgi:proline iminopeptidase
MPLFETPETRVRSQILIRDGQPLFIARSGADPGCPVIVLHGGPGAGSHPQQRQFFDPAIFEVILHDQRGCGRSVSPDLITDNTTEALLQDLRFIQDQLGIDRWILFGGSWGATLALLFAQRWPERTLGLVLRGTFLARATDLDWFLGPSGVRRLFPDAWADLESVIGSGPGHGLMDRLDSALHDDCPLRVSEAARAWEQWGAVVTLGDALRAPLSPSDPRLQKVIEQARIEIHYARHRYFLEENQILKALPRLADLPVELVHGRRDWVCPVAAAFDVTLALPAARLELVEMGGHVPIQRDMIEALKGAVQRLYRRLSG